LPEDQAREVEIVKGPNIGDFPQLDPLPDRLELPVLLIVGDDISTDEILPAGADVLPYRSNIPKIAEFAFGALDADYPDKARESKVAGGHAVLGGRNYGQGSSREHAALAPRYLGLRAVIARSFARIHLANLVNFGVLPLTFDAKTRSDAFEIGSTVVLEDLHQSLRPGQPLAARIGDRSVELEHGLSERQVEILRAGGLINWSGAKGAKRKSASGSRVERLEAR
jgi:aconitate hydratase